MNVQTTRTFFSQHTQAKIEQKLHEAAKGDGETLRELVDSTVPLLYMLLDVVAHSSDPVLRGAALEVYVRREVKPRVVAICEGGIEGKQHQTICMAVAESLGKYQPIAGYGLLAPFCERVCWHSCAGESHAGGQVC